MNEQQPLGQTNQNSPKKSILKSKFFIIAILIILIAGGWYIYSKEKSPTTSFDKSEKNKEFDDSDMRISYPATPPVTENSATAFNTLKNNFIPVADLKTIEKYIADSNSKNLPPVTQANKIISKYSSLIKIVNDNASKPYYCNLGKGELCSMGNIPSMAYLSGLQALVLFEQNKATEAQKTASNIINLGKNITAYADTEITLLVGWIAQKTGYQALSIINSKNKTSLYSETEKEALINKLRSEHKKALQYGYTRMAENIDYITSIDKKPINQSTAVYDESALNEYRKAIVENPKSWNPIETKGYFYNSYKTMISNVELPCGENIPSSTTQTLFDSKNQKDENYIGKTLYSISYADISTLNAKRCEVELAIKNL